MTATHVNGLAVIASEPARSGWKHPRTGEPLKYRQMLRLLLEDGSEVFGCLHCDYTHPSLNSVRPHLNKHRDPREERHELRALPGVDMSDLAALGRRLQEYAQVCADRDTWKSRALKAEGDLRKLRSLLGVTS